MTTLFINQDVTPETNPLDVVEQVICHNEWPYERIGDEEITAAVSGAWCEVHLRYMWRADVNIMQIAAVFDMRVPKAKRQQIYETLSLANERIWLGHFELWSDEGMIIFRHASLMEDQSQISGTQIEALTHTALTECERFYPVFQFVIWADKDPESAVEAAMLETLGEA
jgi:hypothetical protein